MNQMESMDVDSICNDFDDKENSLLNSNVLPRTPSTEKGYEELDVSELNMKLRYSMTPASSPMSRSFTANCRDSKVCDNENNSMNSMLNDNLNLSHSFNSTITDSTIKSSKLPLQVLPTEQFVDDNGNPIGRALDIECNNVTITVNGSDTIDDHLSLPSTSSSLVHTPEATTPTKDIVKDGGSPIMRGLKTVLNMFRSSQSPIPPDDIVTNDLSTSESQKKDEATKFTTNFVLTPTTTNKNNKNISKTNSPIKESLVFNEDLEKELLWKDEITILFKEEKIPVHKLFFPPNSVPLDTMNLKATEKSNINNTIENMDISFHENVVTDIVEKCPFVESDTLNGPESDSEFVDCETSYTKNDTRILDNSMPVLSENINNLSPELSITDVNTFQTIEIVEKNISSPVVKIDVANDINEGISNINNFIKKEDIEDLKQTITQSDLQFQKNSQINNLSNTLSEDIPNTIANENINKLVQCKNETFDFKQYSDTIDAQTDKEVLNMSFIVDNNASLHENPKEVINISYLSQDHDSTVVLNELTMKNSVEAIEIRNITLPLESPADDIEIKLGVVQDQIKKEMPSNDSEIVSNVGIKCNTPLDTELILDTIKRQEHNNERDTLIFSDHIIRPEVEEITTIDNNLPSDIPLPYDSDMDKENLFDINEDNAGENNKSGNISCNTTNLDLAPERVILTIDENMSLTEKPDIILYSAIDNIVADTSILQTAQSADPENICCTINDMSVNENNILKTETNNIEKCIPKVMEDQIEVPSKIIDSTIFPSNNKCSVSGIYVDVITNQEENRHLNITNHDELLEANKPNDYANEIENTIDVKIQNNDGCPSSPYNNTLVTRFESEFCVNGSEDSDDPFKTKNKLTSSLEVRHSGAFAGDTILQNDMLKVAEDKVYVQAINEEVVISLDNINTSVIGMDIDVIEEESYNYKNLYKMTNISTNPTSHNNSSVTKMEIDVSKPELDYGESTIKTKKQEQENVPTNCNEDISSKCDFKINKVINDPLDSKDPLTKMELDISKNDLISSDNITKSHPDIDYEDCKIGKNNLPDEEVKIKDKSDSAINSEIVLPSSKKIFSESLDVSKYDENNIESACETNCLRSFSPPISSTFTRNNYSINSSEIDNPFTTITNIRMSPDPGKDISHNKSIKIKTDFEKRPLPNRRKTMNDRKEPNVIKNRFNASLCELNGKEIDNTFHENVKVPEMCLKDSINHDNIKNIYDVSSSSDKLQDIGDTNISNNCTIIEQTTTESSVEECYMGELSFSPKEIFKSKNVFNLPEIDDINFNPFATKTKIHQSPPEETENMLSDKSNINNNQGTEDLEPDRIDPVEVETYNVLKLDSNLSPNLSNVTSSPKHTDNVTSIQEVHTEDEDTVEGPFLEAQDFADIVKVTELETKKDMMNFEDLPTQTNDENENGEFFIDADAFEFLLNQNKSNVVADSGKESLFLKFDPLFAKRVSSDGVLAALNKIQKRQSTPKKMTPLKVMLEESATPGPSITTPIGKCAPVTNDIIEEPIQVLSKPMMVVNPAIASSVSLRKSTTPPRVNRRSLTITSPAMAVIDRLLSLSGNNSTLDQDSSLPQNREYNETDFALTQLRELLAEKEIHVHNLRSETKELKERLGTLELQVRSLETESEERLLKVKELNEHLAEKNKINKSMAIVVEEYERTIASLIAEMEQEKKQNAEERMKLISERDEQTAHLASMEVSFSDLHSKYEKSKQIILSMKSNEDTYKKSLNEFEVNLLKMQTNYDLLKQHATSKLNHANQELEKFNRAHDAEVLKLNAMIKRKDLHITSLEESLSQKTKANEELTAICDELINKVG